MTLPSCAHTAARPDSLERKIEGFQEAAASRRRDLKRAAVAHAFEPFELEATLREGSPHCAADMRAALGPVDARTAEYSALGARLRQVDPEPGQKSRAGLGDLAG